jgi:cytochrome c-type biogenesis protein CcmH/NrfF
VRRAAILLGVVFVALSMPAVAVAASCPKTTVSALENEVMCQVCGVPLALATDAPQAKRERAFIARLVARCESKGQIERALVAQFGPSVLAEPPHDGFSVTAYLVPTLAVGLAAALLAWFGIAWRRRREPSKQPELPRLSAPDRARVDAALERWDG